tara:strand:+ start:4589 stop:4816 length:228 start_codon:yes stop_codon:yes gene_type:complete
MVRLPFFEVTSEPKARQKIDAQLSAAGWSVVPSGSLIVNGPTAIWQAYEALENIRSSDTQRHWLDVIKNYVALIA